MENNIWIIVPDHQNEGLGEPYENKYYSSLKEVEEVYLTLKKDYYDYIIFELTKK